jgi:CRP-like cAMP-binding protein
MLTWISFTLKDLDTISKNFWSAALQATLKSPFALKLSAFVDLSPKDTAILVRFEKHKLRFGAGYEMGNHGDTNKAYILTAGWVISYKMMRDGSRQIIDIQVPGDFLGLRSVLLRTSEYHFTPIVEIQAIELLKSDLISIFEKAPRLGTAILWAMSRDESMVVEHLVGLGRRKGEARIAHFLLEIGAKLLLVGMGDLSGYKCPLTQYHIADALEMSPVHVNRVLTKLRNSGLVTFRNGRVKFDNFNELVKMAEFDVSYLDHRGPLLK